MIARVVDAAARSHAKRGERRLHVVLLGHRLASASMYGPIAGEWMCLLATATFWITGMCA